MGLVAGLLVLAALTCLAVMHLERRAIEQALAEQERSLEAHMGRMVRRLTSEEGGGLGRVGARLAAAAKYMPAILDLVVVDPDQRVVRHFSRSGTRRVPCVAVVPLDVSVEHGHAAGEVAPLAVLCKTEPVALGERWRDRYGGSVEIAGDAEARVDVTKVDDAISAIVEFLGRKDGAGPRLTLSGTRSEWRLVAEGASAGGETTDMGKLFDPYVRAGPHDVGRGLALARAVFQAHGGDLVAQRKGARLVLRGSAPRIPPGEK